MKSVVFALAAIGLVSMGSMSMKTTQSPSDEKMGTTNDPTTESQTTSDTEKECFKCAHSMFSEKNCSKVTDDVPKVSCEGQCYITKASDENIQRGCTDSTNVDCDQVHIECCDTNLCNSGAIVSG
ncbi:uncharacterized protein [Amphiura filiformis]|uniref:uncharacterized protein n=1 Tax=Amphiura filiformis TaxID=82378 RepID=UPI003B21C625